MLAWFQFQEVAAGWAAALGTFAAAGAAVWLGVRDILERKRQRQLDAAVLQEFIAPECEAAIRRLQAVKAELDSLANFGEIGTTKGTLRAESIRTVVVETALGTVISNVARFSVFDQPRSHALARAAGKLKLLEQVMTGVAVEAGPHVDVDKLKRITDEARTLVRGIQEDLRDGVGASEDDFQRLIRGPIELIVDPSDRFLDLQRRDLGPLGFQRRQ